MADEAVEFIPAKGRPREENLLSTVPIEGEVAVAGSPCTEMPPPSAPSGSPARNTAKGASGITTITITSLDSTPLPTSQPNPLKAPASKWAKGAPLDSPPPSMSTTTTDNAEYQPRPSTSKCSPPPLLTGPNRRTSLVVSAKNSFSNDHEDPLFDNVSIPPAETPRINANESVISHPSPNTTTTSETSPLINYQPNKNLAVICDSLDGFPIEAYIISLSKVIPPHRIRYASRLSLGRICFYLQSESDVFKVLDSYGLELDGTFLPLRKYMSSSTKVVLSNVIPDIPDSILIKHLAPYGKITSPIKEMFIGTKNPMFQHIKVFRRMVYMLIPKPESLPTSIPVTYDGTTYNVYLTLDDIMCYHCKNKGHISRRCPSLDNNPGKLLNEMNFPTLVQQPLQQEAIPTVHPPPKDSPPSSSGSLIPESKEETKQITGNSTDLTKKIKEDTPTMKLAPSLPSSSASTLISTTTQVPKVSKRVQEAPAEIEPAKRLAVTVDAMDETLTTDEEDAMSQASVQSGNDLHFLKRDYKNPTDITQRRLGEFIREAARVKNIMPLALKYTNNVKQLRSKIEEVAKLSKYKAMRQKANKILDKINRQYTESEGDET